VRGRSDMDFLGPRSLEPMMTTGLLQATGSSTGQGMSIRMSMRHSVRRGFSPSHRIPSEMRNDHRIDIESMSIRRRNYQIDIGSMLI